MKRIGGGFALWCCILGMSSKGHSQAQQPSTPSVASATPLITADFTESKTSFDQRLSPGLRFCQGVFQDSLLNHLHEMDHQFAPVAIVAGRECLRQIGGGDQLPASDWSFLLRFAIALNDDALVQRVVARQLSAGVNVRDRVAVLEHVITVLIHNRWLDIYGDSLAHVTPAHTALARQYATQLDTMQPAGQVVAARLRVFRALNALDTAAWNVDTELARARRFQQIATSVPRDVIPPDDTAFVLPTPLEISRLIYLKTPTHANLASWIATRDSLLDVPKGQTIDSLLNHPSGRLDCDYWFGPPTGQTGIGVPAHGAVSLILFGESFQEEMVTQVQHLHEQYPKLQIIVVTMIRGTSQDRYERDQLAEEVKRIDDRFKNDLHLPGSVCVLQTKYHTEPGMTAIPFASPVLDRFHLDPRRYAHHAFLVDADGWIVEDRWSFVLDGKLIQRLFVP